MNRGFTLIEVLVGMTVAALALTAGFATLGIVGERADRAERATVAALSGAATRDLLTQWLAGAQQRAPRRGEYFQGLDSDEQGTESDELIFPTTARTPLGIGVTVIRLFVDSDAGTPEVGLVAEMWERRTDERRTIQLFPSVGAIELSYLPDVPEAVEWLPSWISTRRMPMAVELQLIAQRGDTLPALLRYPIRQPLGVNR